MSRPVADVIKLFWMGRGGGQVVSMVTFYSDDPSSNPADAYRFSVKNCVWKERNLENLDFSLSQKIKNRPF